MCIRDNTDSVCRDRPSHSSDEVPVTGTERRAWAVQLHFIYQLISMRMNLWNGTKSIPISRRMVWEAYQKVRSNQGSAGVDAISMQEFDADRSKHLYKLCLLYTSPSPRDRTRSRMPSSA